MGSRGGEKLLSDKQHLHSRNSNTEAGFICLKVYLVKDCLSFSPCPSQILKSLQLEEHFHQNLLKYGNTPLRHSGQHYCYLVLVICIANTNPKIMICAQQCFIPGYYVQTLFAL